MATPEKTVLERFIPVKFPQDASQLLALDPNGTRVAVSWVDASDVQVFNIATGKVHARPKGFHRVSGIAFLSHQELLVTAYPGCYRCTLPRGERELLAEEGWQTSVTVSPVGGLVTLGIKPGITLLDVRERATRSLRVGYGTQYGRWAVFSPGERYVAAELGNEADRQPSLIAVWEVPTGRRQRVFDTNADTIAFRGDTLNLAFANDHGQILLYEADQGEEPVRWFSIEQPLTHVGVQALQYRNQGRTLATLLSDGHFVLFDVEKGLVLRQSAPPNGKPLCRAVSNAAWSALAAAAERGVMIWPAEPAEKA